MFSKLKDKLKETLSVFSKKTEEEAEVKETEQAEETPEEITEETLKETPEEQPVKEEVQQPDEEPKEPIKETAEEPKTEEKPAEEPITEEKTEEKKAEEIPVPEKYNVANHGFTPDVEKIQEIKKEIESQPEVKEETPKEAEKKEPEKETEEKSSFFKKIKQTITTKTISEEKFNQLFWDLELLLLGNNVSVEVIEKIKKDLKTELVDKPLPRDVPKKIQETLKQTLNEILSLKHTDLLAQIKKKESKPFVIAFFGINGSGKTTTVAKLSHLLQKNGLKTVLAASDTFRAAAIQQLEEHAQKLNTPIIKQDYGSDAAAVAFDAIQYAQKNKSDVVLIDTAGRLHSNINLMDELKKIVRVTNPDLKLFVGESITGNDCIEQAKKFNEMIDIDAAVLTKADIDEKGGAPLSISYTIKKPIIFLGVGQEYKDIEEFSAQTILNRLGL